MLLEYFEFFEKKYSRQAEETFEEHEVGNDDLVDMVAEVFDDEEAHENGKNIYLLIIKLWKNFELLLL